MAAASTDPKRAAREAAQQHLAEFLALLRSRSDEPKVREVIEAGEHLKRAIDAFHMEAIRFRVYTIDRFVRQDPAAGQLVGQIVTDLRAALEAAGFQTSSKGL